MTAHLQELAVGAVHGSFLAVGEQTNHAAVHRAVLRASAEGLDATPHFLGKIKIRPKKKKKKVHLWLRLRRRRRGRDGVTSAVRFLRTVTA